MDDTDQQHDLLLAIMAEAQTAATADADAFLARLDLTPVEVEFVAQVSEQACDEVVRLWDEATELGVELSELAITAALATATQRAERWMAHIERLVEEHKGSK